MWGGTQGETDRDVQTQSLSQTGVRESLRHARSNRKKAPTERNTHTHPGDRKARRQEGRSKSKKVGGREGKEVGKEGKKSGCGRKGQRAGLKHQEGSRE